MYLKGSGTEVNTLYYKLLGTGAVPLRLISQTSKVSSSGHTLSSHNFRKTMGSHIKKAFQPRALLLTP